MRRWYDRWSATVAFMLLAVVASLSVYPPGLVLVLLACATAAVWWSPLRRGRHVAHAEAAARGGVTVYWKPGCLACARLRWNLPTGVCDVVSWVNIWRDDDAAAFVAGLNDGNELTPTVVVDGVRVDADATLIEHSVDAR